MSECTDIEKKYIKEYEAGLIIRIERAGKLFKKKMPYRKHGGLKNTWIRSKKIRDDKYFELFNTEITKRFFHIKSKSKKGNLPSGLSYGYSRNKLLYIVASYNDTPGHVSRKRYNINELGVSGAIKKGILFLISKREQLT